MTYWITPDTRKIVLLMTLTAPLQHSDPRQGMGGSNEKLFARQKKRLPQAAAPINWGEVARFIDGLRWPSQLAALVNQSGLSVVDVLGVMVLREYIKQHNGEGLMQGVDRYRLLTNRATNCAVKSATAHGFWSALCRAMGAGEATDIKERVTDEDTQARLTVGVNESTIKLTAAMPAALAGAVLAGIAKNAHTYVSLAQAWGEYERGGDDLVLLQVTDAMLKDDHSALIADVPHFSANAIRHKVVREPAALHLLTALGLRLEDLDAGTASLLYNGGEMNRSPEGNVYELTRQIRTAYPSMGLLGGSTPGFLLGASDLEVSCWPVAREYADDLRPYHHQLDAAALDISIFDYLDDQTITRHTAGRVDGSPMPVNNEILAAGLPLLVELRLRPYATALEIGALAHAVETFKDAFATLGGASNRGNGSVKVDVLTFPAEFTTYAADYLDYLSSEGAKLAKGLQDGTLCTGQPVMQKAGKEKVSKSLRPAPKVEPEWN